MGHFVLVHSIFNFESGYRNSMTPLFEYFEGDNVIDN